MQKTLTIDTITKAITKDKTTSINKEHREKTHT